MAKYIIVLFLLSSCSPKGFDFRSGDKEGVRFKRSLPPKTQKAITLIFFFGITPIILLNE